MNEEVRDVIRHARIEYVVRGEVNHGRYHIFGRHATLDKAIEQASKISVETLIERHYIVDTYRMVPSEDAIIEFGKAGDLL